MKTKHKNKKKLFEFKTIQEEEQHIEKCNRMLEGDIDAIVDILFEGGRCTKEDRDYYYNVLKHNEV